MVQSCCAYNCTERFTPNSGYAFHRFPRKNEALLKAWCIAIRRKDFHPRKHSRICSKHFTADSYKAGFKFRKLKRNAIPTIFDFGESKQAQRKSICKKSTIAATSSYKKFLSSKHEMEYFEDDDDFDMNVSSTSENECGQEERVIEVIKLNNYQNNGQVREYSTDSEIAKDCEEDYNEASKGSSSEAMSNNDNIVPPHITFNINQQKQNENEKLRHSICLLHKRMEKFMFLIDCLHATNMISEEAAFVLRSTMEM